MRKPRGPNEWPDRAKQSNGRPLLAGWTASHDILWRAASQSVDGTSLKRGAARPRFRFQT